MPKSDLTILAIDPGTRDLGYAVLQGAHLIDAGVLTLRNVPPKHRLTRVRRALERWLRADQPDALVLEYMPRKPTVPRVGLPALGRTLHRLADEHGMELATYSARAVRRALLNNGWAGKPEVVAPLVARYPQLRVYRGQDRKWKARYWHNMFDAIALGRHHLELTQRPSRSR